MNAKELRIGNIIQSTEFKNPFSVDYQNIGFVILEPDKYEPVELTPEWLERFKFQNNTYGNGNGFYDKHYSKLIGVYLRILLWKHLNGFSIHFISHNAFLKEWRYKDLTFYKHKLQHVHQLQNLYFALTGEELV